MKIMLVDGTSSMRRVVKILLRQNGYRNFVEAENFECAKKALKDNPDIGFIVADWEMQDGNGVDFIKGVRKLSTFKATPFLIVTAENDEDDAAKAINSIPRGQVIVKPFTGASLLNKMSGTTDKSKNRGRKKLHNLP